MRNILNTTIIVLSLVLFLQFTLKGQTTVFSDDFSTNTSLSWTTGGVINSSAWSVVRSGDDWGARRNTSPAQLELSNDIGAIFNNAGWVFAYTNSGSYPSPYNPTLGLNTGVITWTFNMRQIRTDPAGFNSGSYGVAFVLGATSTAIQNTGTGYAVVLGQSGTTDPVRLAKFSAGLQGGLTNLIVSNTTGLTDFGAEYLSIKVTYDPSTNLWQLFLRNDGSTAFADPNSGILVSQGTYTDNTYTSTSLTYSGGYWQGSTLTGQTAFFDNVKVTFTPNSIIAVSPSSLAGFIYSLGSGPSASQSFTISGTNLSPSSGNIKVYGSIDFQVSHDNVTFGDSVVLAYASGTLSAQTIYVRLEASLTEGLYTGENIVCSGGSAQTKNVAVSGEVFKTQPDNNPTGLSATSSWSRNSAVTVSWTDVTTTPEPSGYLIKGNTAGFSSIAPPVDGVPEADGGLIKNVLQGYETYTFTGLNAGITYYFKVFPYSNSGLNIDYKTNGTVPTTVATTMAAPDGMKDNPYTCEQAIANNTGNDKWVYGYIVGFALSPVSADLDPPYTSSQNTNIVIADDMFETDIAKMLFIQLPNDAVIRGNLNLYSNASNYHKRVVIRGDLQQYYVPHKGMQNTDDYCWYEPTCTIAQGNWNSASVWTTGIPYHYDDVTIYHPLHVDAASYCNDMIIFPEITLYIDALKILTISGSVTLKTP
jgi:hypothetical protein